MSLKKLVEDTNRQLNEMGWSGYYSGKPRSQGWWADGGANDEGYDRYGRDRAQKQREAQKRRMDKLKFYARENGLDDEQYWELNDAIKDEFRGFNHMYAAIDGKKLGMSIEDIRKVLSAHKDEKQEKLQRIMKKAGGAEEETPKPSFNNDIPEGFPQEKIEKYKDNPFALRNSIKKWKREQGM